MTKVVDEGTVEVEVDFESLWNTKLDEYLDDLTEAELAKLRESHPWEWKPLAKPTESEGDRMLRQYRGLYGKDN